MNIKFFASTNFTMEVLQGSTVSFRYKFKDFRGTTAVFAPWEALLETRCQSLNTTMKVDIPLYTINTTEFPGFEGDFRWIHRLDDRPREEPTQLCKSSAGLLVSLIMC